MFDDLKGLSILVTGSSTGIGAAAAKAYAEYGAKVAVHGSANKERAEALVSDIKSSGGEAVLVMGDLFKRGAVEQVVTEAADALGGLDVLVNNAGSLVRREALDTIDDDLYDAVCDLNVRAVINACRAAAPFLRNSKSGSIINTGSIAGHNGGAVGAGLYAGAKAFVHSWTRTMAIELGPDGIRVNCVSPGTILTPFHERFSTPEKLENVRRMIHLGRLGTPEDCVGAYLFLASPKASGFITGQVIEVNGGQYFK